MISNVPGPPQQDMIFNELSKTFSSFRAQLMAFIAGMLILTTFTLYVFNLRSENLITQQMKDYVQATGQAVELALRSLAGDEFLYEMVDPNKGGTLQVNSESIIRKIVVIDSVTNVVDNSTDPNDIKNLADEDITDLPLLALDELGDDDIDQTGDRANKIEVTFETERTKRKVIIVVSMKRIDRVIAAAARDRLIAIGLLGLLMVALLFAFSHRFTRPVTELSQAAQRVTAGDLGFEVPVSGPEEINRLSSTFNEMIVELRRSRDLEEQLQRAERSAVVGRLASGIAHEIRNPLNFINLSIDYLREKFAPQADNPRAEYTRILTTIKDELARLNRLVSDFLSYGRPAKLKLREVNARTLIEEVRTLVAAQAEQQSVNINIQQNGNGNGILQADAELLKTCFSNLMINAVQAMPEGGTLNITLSPNSSLVEVEFADNGPGISPEALEQIFEPYYSTKETGIGLGLPLTKKIIEEHGGQISVKSEPNSGATFTVVLPR
jgi:signal transduction histidine kinase